MIFGREEQQQRRVKGKKLGTELNEGGYVTVLWPHVTQLVPVPGLSGCSHGLC